MHFCCSLEMGQSCQWGKAVGWSWSKAVGPSFLELPDQLQVVLQQPFAAMGQNFFRRLFSWYEKGKRGETQIGKGRIETEREKDQGSISENLNTILSVLFKHHCCIFRPAFGGCAPQMLVEIVIFSIFSAKSFFGGNKTLNQCLGANSKKKIVFCFIWRLMIWSMTKWNSLYNKEIWMSFWFLKCYFLVFKTQLLLALKMLILSE